MIPNWREGLLSPELQVRLMLSDTTESLYRQVAVEPSVLLLLHSIREDPDSASEVLAFARELALSAVSPDETGEALMPLCCCIFVLSKTVIAGGRQLVADLGASSSGALRWVPRFARMCIAKSSVANSLAEAQPVPQALSLQSLSATPLWEASSASGNTRDDDQSPLRELLVA